jgi:hypothetical protein
VNVTVKLHLQNVIYLILDDVAEKPSRLVQAQALADEAIDEAIDKAYQEVHAIYADTEADGVVFCGNCGEMRGGKS